MTHPAELAVVPIGDNKTLTWSMLPVERLRRMAAKVGLPFEPNGSDRPLILVNLDYAFDPQLLRYMASVPSHLLVDPQGVPVMAHLAVSDHALAADVGDAMERHTPASPTGLATLVADESFTLYNHQLRKREAPFVMRLSPDTRSSIERASYYAAYKGVTDLLTKYLWPEAALVLTKAAARLGISPNGVTAIGAALCVLATILFWHGAYWYGMAAGLVFMVLDTVDGKLARCTLTSSKWGNIFDHGIDQVHPPFWWWAWAVGLSHWGLAFPPREFAIILSIVIGGYFVQRLIEGIFVRTFGMHIHVWEGVDSQFRLITARRNPNMVLLFVALLFGRPDIGLELVAAWTILSCLFHAVRLAQALIRRHNGGEVSSWLR